MGAGRLLGLTLAGLILGSASRGQKVVELTEARKKVVNEWVQAVAKGGGIKVKGKGADVSFEIDDKKMRAAVSARKDKINADLIDTLAAATYHADPRFVPLLVALLRACGGEKKDHRAQGFAALFAAGAAKDTARLKDAARDYRVAAKHFASAKEAEWQSASLNNLGLVLAAQGDHAAALQQFREELTV